MTSDGRTCRQYGSPIPGQGRYLNGVGPFCSQECSDRLFLSPTPSDASPNSCPNAIIVSDFHAGSRHGLCPPHDIQLQDGGGSYKPSRLQRVVHEYWDFFWNEWVPSVCHGQPFVVVVNGDAVDGRPFRSVHHISDNPEDQHSIAMQLIEPIVDRAERAYIVRGTEVHVGKSGCQEERIARELAKAFPGKVTPDRDGHFSRNDLWLRVGNGLCHLLHHIGTTGTSHYESTAVLKEFIAELEQAARWGQEPPHVIARSHRHIHCEVRVPTGWGYGIAFVTPGWQLKMLDLETPLPTPSGWITMGTVQEGDTLFDERGAPCKVVSVHPINLRPESYYMRFSNGETVKACADHLWQTTAAVDRPGVPGHGSEKRPLTRIRTTREIAETLRFGKRNSLNHKLHMPMPLALEEAALGIDPYVLGCWLGDGDSDAARLTCSQADAAQYDREFRRVGYGLSWQEVSEKKCPIFTIQALSADGESGVARGDSRNLQGALRRCGLLNNKHIPECYLRGSITQRLSLVQGLMDTDGHADLHGGACFFTSSRERLFDGFCELLASLGIKYTTVWRTAKLNGQATRPFGLCRFFVSPDILPVFRLQRKLERVPETTARRTAPKSRVVGIVACDPCDPVPMRCIVVDSPSGLYRFGKTMLYTHNTPFAWRIPGGRLAPPQFGGSLIRQGDHDLYTRHWVQAIERTQTEG